MRRIFIVALIALLLPIGTQAQKYGCVNTEYILNNIPDYAQAQTQINKLSEGWQKEIENRFIEIDKLYKTYQQEAYLLPDNLKRKREEEIIAKERETKDLQNKYFGPGGELDKKREELMKPIQDRVYGAIERIAGEKGYAFVFDKSGSATVLFASAKYDISEQVLDMLGYKPSTGGNESTGNKKTVNNPEMNRPK